MLADIVERLSNWKHASFRRDGSTLETMNEAADEITTLRARVKELESGGWISVEDRLPPFIENKSVSENVLGVCGGRICVFNRFSDCDNWSWCRANYLWKGLHEAEGEFDDDYEVTHWQPLPNPPKD